MKKPIVVRLHWLRGLSRIELDKCSLRLLRSEITRRTGISAEDQHLFLDASGEKPLNQRSELKRGVQVYLFSKPCNDDEIESKDEDAVDELESFALDKKYARNEPMPCGPQEYAHVDLVSIDRGALQVFMAPHLADMKTEMGLLIGSSRASREVRIDFVLEDADFGRGERVAKSLGLHVVGCIIDGGSRSERTVRACFAVQEEHAASSALFVCVVAESPRQGRVFALKDRAFAYRDGSLPLRAWDACMVELGPLRVHPQQRAFARPFRSHLEDDALLEERTRRRARNALAANADLAGLASDFHFLYGVSVLWGHGAVRRLVAGHEKTQRQILQTLCA